MKASRQGLALCRRWNRIAKSGNCQVLLGAKSDGMEKSSCHVATTTWNRNSASSDQQRRWFSAVEQVPEYQDDSNGPVGELFQFPEVGPELVGKKGSIRRVFGPQSNADAMITCGGEALAAHASFDPDYGRARDWIRSHPVGPAVLSPVLISGLVGTLVEAAFPQSIAMNVSMQLERPLIVGVDVRAKIEVVAASHTGKPETFDHHGPPMSTTTTSAQTSFDDEEQKRKRNTGYQVDLNTLVVRVRDDLVIAKGTHSVWIPDYLHM